MTDKIVTEGSITYIYHYPEEPDGSLEEQPCTCGAGGIGCECHCNDGLVHVEVDPQGQSHIWPCEPGV